MHARNQSNTWKYVQSGKKIEIYVRGDFKSDGSQLLAHMAAQSLGFAYLPDFTVDGCLKNGDLISVLDDFMPSPLGMYVVYPDREYISKKLEIVIRFLKEVLGNHND